MTQPSTRHSPPPPPEPKASRLARLAGVASTSAAVGIAATAVDWCTLVVAVWAGMSERWAVVPAFIAGVVVQFSGNQRFAFRAHGGGATALRRQIWRFSLVEVGTLALTAIVYNLFREALSIDYRLSRLFSASVVYFGFSLPLWHWVFAKPQSHLLKEHRNVGSEEAAGSRAA